MNEKVEVKGESVRSEVLTKVGNEYVSKVEMADKGYATKESVDGLSKVARSGGYGDLIGSPDLSVYKLGSEIESEYVDNGELTSALSEYIRGSEVSRVGKTRVFEDLEGKPEMSEYQRVEEMSNYISASEFANEMQGVVKVGSGTSIDLSGYVKTSEMTDTLLSYARSDGLSEVAVSGAFSDLSGISEVVNEGRMASALGEYVSKSELADERAEIDGMYYDESELGEELTG